MRCPYYQEECIEDGCAAYEYQEYTCIGGKEESAHWAYSAEMEHLIRRRPYCHALKKEIPYAVH
jgi:hypothetical protein